MKIKISFFLFLYCSVHCSFAQTKNNDAAHQLLSRCFTLAYQYPDSVILYSTETIQIAKQTDDVYLEACAYNELGNAVRIKGDIEKALTYFFKSISLLGNSEKELGKKAAVYSSIGNAYYQSGDFDQATYYYAKAYYSKKELGREFESAIAATQLAGIYAIHNNPDSTFYLARIAEPVLIKNNADQYLANLYNAVGSAHQMLGSFDSALYFFNRAAEKFTLAGFIIQLQPIYYNVGNVLYEQKKYSESLIYLNKGLKVFEDYPNLNLEEVYYEAFYKSHEALGNFSIALDYKKKQDSVQAIILKGKEEAAFVEMEEKFKLVEQEQKLQQQKFDIQQKDLDLLRGEEKFYRLLTFGILIFGILIILSFWFWFKKQSQEKIEKEKERFFSNVMHEIRTPLSLITGPAENLKNNLSEVERTKNFELINRNSKRLTTLVNQLLDVSKIDSGKFTLIKKSGNLEVFVREISENFEMQAAQKQIELNLKQHSTNKIIRSDFDALEKILSNLISNALKYSPSKTIVTIEVELNQNQLRLSVHDQGAGISKADQQEIFSRFSRGKNAKLSSGVGIGLSLVKQLVNLLGGSITVESKVGVGSLFSVELPIELSEIETDLRTISDEAQVVLLVEDDIDMRDFIRSVLEKQNFQVVCAEHGKQALEILKDILPDLILSDVMMPEMDGLTLAEEIRKNELFAHIPVILLSAKKSSDTKISGLGKGADLYLEKPFNPNELLLTVQNFLSTLKKAREKFDSQIKKELSFEEKIHSDDHYIQKLNAEILKELDNADFSVEELSDRLAISRSQLHRKVKSLTGKSISIYVRIIRLEKAYEMLKKNAGNVTEIAYSTGFSSQSYFSKCFTEHFGKAPSEL